ncbi:MAG: hypothetical protein EBU84_20565, partial [Actinobacteria bacterium]|nr:hypothetical protein [Actinomycetota bacterium]
SANLSDNGGATSLAKTGLGTWVLTGSSTASGSVNVTSGVLRVTNPGAFGTSTALNAINMGSATVEFRNDSSMNVGLNIGVPGSNSTAFFDRPVGGSGSGALLTLGSLSLSAQYASLNLVGAHGYGVTFTGPIIGRPRSATFRTADVVGLDTLVRVAKGVAENCPNDEARAQFDIPAWLQKMVDNNWLGDKTGQGFFKKTKSATGEKEILTLNLQTLEYGPRTKPKFASVDAAKQIDALPERLKMLVAASDKAGEFYKHFHYGLFSYISHRIPEISDELYRVDDALMAGFGWEIGAFESWDVLGVGRMVESMEKAGYVVAPWVKEMIAGGIRSFYKLEQGKRHCYDPISKSYQPLPGGDAYIMPSHRGDQVVWKNSSCKLVDLGDSVLALHWNTKMGSIGGDVLSGIQTA